MFCGGGVMGWGGFCGGDVVGYGGFFLEVT